jgi:hypothetical protein
MGQLRARILNRKTLGPVFTRAVRPPSFPLESAHCRMLRRLHAGRRGARVDLEFPKTRGSRVSLKIAVIASGISELAALWSVASRLDVVHCPGAK